MHIRDRETFVRTLDDIERVVREMGENLEHLRHPERWDDFGPEYDDQFQYVQRHLASFDETTWILARLRDVRQALDPAPPAGGS